MKKSIGRKKSIKKVSDEKKVFKKSINYKMFWSFISVQIQYTNVIFG